MELPEPVRLRLGNFSRTVFRDSNRTEPEDSEGPGEWPRPSAGSVAAEAQLGCCQDPKWRRRLQRAPRCGSTWAEGPGLGRLRSVVAAGAGLVTRRPGPPVPSWAAEVELA